MRNSVGTWLSLVEHSLGVRGVGSSNLPVPTNFIFLVFLHFFAFSRSSASAFQRLNCDGTKLKGAAPQTGSG
jgi:hypothetical protein